MALLFDLRWKHRLLASPRHHRRRGCIVPRRVLAIGFEPSPFHILFQRSFQARGAARPASELAGVVKQGMRRLLETTSSWNFRPFIWHSVIESFGGSMNKRRKPLFDHRSGFCVKGFVLIYAKPSRDQKRCGRLMILKLTSDECNKVGDALSFWLKRSTSSRRFMTTFFTMMCH